MDFFRVCSVTQKHSLSTAQHYDYRSYALCCASLQYLVLSIRIAQQTKLKTGRHTVCFFRVSLSEISIEGVQTGPKPTRACKDRSQNRMTTDWQQKSAAAGCWTTPPCPTARAPSNLAGCFVPALFSMDRVHMLFKGRSCSFSQRMVFVCPFQRLSAYPPHALFACGVPSCVQCLPSLDSQRLSKGACPWCQAAKPPLSLLRPLSAPMHASEPGGDSALSETPPKVNLEYSSSLYL